MTREEYLNLSDKRDLQPADLPSPRAAAKAHCQECVGGSAVEAKQCNGGLLGSTGPKCRLWAVTHADAGKVCKAIRAECKVCQGDSARGVGECRSYGCALWPFRLGKNPKLVGRAARGVSVSGRSLVGAKITQGATLDVSDDQEDGSEALGLPGG